MQWKISADIGYFLKNGRKTKGYIIENCSSLLFSPVQRTRSAAMSSCAFGASAVRMRPKEKPAALVNTRVTAAPTSAVLFIKVQHNPECGVWMTRCIPFWKWDPSDVCFLCLVLLFPICLAKPVERERCFGAPNHLMDLLSWDIQNGGPRKHCPCVGELHCQHLGWVRCPLRRMSTIRVNTLKYYAHVFRRRGSMCLKVEDESEEDLTDSLYSEIDYII